MYIHKCFLNCKIRFLGLFLGILIQTTAATLPTGFTESRLADGLDPTGVSLLEDGRVLITIKSGKVLLVKNDVLQSTPFLTIPNLDNWNERGLLNIVPDPDFALNQFVYVYYTFKGATASNNRVSRFKINGDVMELGSEQVLINFNSLSNVGYHNGGGLVFGTDGKLYASTGENTVSSNSQSLNTLHGKVIRINKDGTIPTDNPFYNVATGQNRAIYAMGFRNPFKMKIQPTTGKIYVNDVGGNNWEEINELKSGRNYGWPAIEGKIANQTPPNNYEDPVYAFNHSNGACSITGGTFYNPPVQHFPSQYQGKYFFADYCAGWIKYTDPANNYAISDFASAINRPLDMAVDQLGNFYYIARGGLAGGSDAANTSSSTGELWKISYTGNGDVSITVQPQSKTVATGANVTFVVSASGSAPIRYQWRLNGNNIQGATGQNYSIDTAKISMNGNKYSVVVSNNTSTKTSNEAVLTVKNNTAPVPVITSPFVNYLYEAGTSFNFSGTATDAEDGELPASAFTWSIRFQHDTHFHPAMDALTGTKSGIFNISDMGETSDTVWYRVYLTVTDVFGTKSTVYRDVFPKKVDVTLNTIPTGLPLKLDGVSVTTPYTFKGVVGLKREIKGDNTIASGNSIFAFTQWSNNGLASQVISTPKANTTYTAMYISSTTDTLSVVADAYVRGGTNANNTYGTTDPTQLQSKTETTFDLTRQTFLRFEISQSKSIYGAKLRLFGRKNSVENSNINVGVYAVSNTTWNENTISWNNKPTADTVLLSNVKVNALAPGQFYEWDVSEYIRLAKSNGASTISFMVANGETTASYVAFNSKESGTNIPQLILTIPENVLEVSNEIENNSSVSVFPNPFMSSSILQLPEELEYTIYDLAGHGLKTGVGVGKIEFGRDLNSGYYILVVKNKKSTQFINVVKQ